VIRHIQHLSFESLVKMDHFPKEPQKRNHWGTRAGEVLENRHYMERRHYEGRMRVEDQARAAAANR
jgi:hypothetical protein